MRAVKTIEIENARRINLGTGWVTLMKDGSFDEKVIDYFESRSWCHNVTSITNFRKVNQCNIACDVEYNQA